MTFSVQRGPDGSLGKQAIVRTTYGPVTNEVLEPVTDLRSFWGDLGRFLDEAEKPEESSDVAGV